MFKEKISCDCKAIFILFLFYIFSFLGLYFICSFCFSSYEINNFKLATNSKDAIALAKIYYKNGMLKKAYSIVYPWSRSGEKDVEDYITLMYLGGQMTIESMPDSMNFFDKSISRGNYKSAYRLGLLYDTAPYGIVTDKEKWIHYISLAAEAGNIEAQYYLGWCYLYGYKDLHKDYSKALHWLEKAAEQGDKNAIAQIGRMYREGLGVQKNYAKAIDYIKNAADLGNPDAEFVLAIDYLSDKATLKENMMGALHLLYDSAKHGSSDALVAIGLLNKCSGDNETAEIYFSKAKGNGFDIEKDHEKYELLKSIISGIQLQGIPVLSKKTSAR